jgi:HAE1 family hydrophobic/amphiphilic exporter-1/multidrug efflux pump
VFGGTISGTVLGVVFVPLFFVIVTRLFRGFGRNA